MPLLGDGSKSSVLGSSVSGRRALSNGNQVLSRRSAWSESEFGEALSSAQDSVSRPGTAREQPTGLAAILSACSNPGCRSGWLHLLRSRSGPVFEGGWTCSSACTTARIETAVRRELDGRRSEEAASHRHRVPLGLVMLEQGWITSEKLRRALDAQRSAQRGKLGHWLVRQQGVSEQCVTRALSLQWSCPVLAVDNHDPEVMTPALPRLFVEAFGALCVRVAAGTILYLGFEDRLDPVLALATERMLGLRVETGLVRGSLFRSAQQRMLSASFPPTQLVETASESPIVRVLARAIERARPVESRLVRMHDCLWLRMWSRPQAGPLPEVNGVEDVVCSLVAS